MRTVVALAVAAALSVGVAVAAGKKEEPKPKTLEQVVVDIVMAPVKLVQDLMKK